MKSTRMVINLEEQTVTTYEVDEKVIRKGKMDCPECGKKSSLKWRITQADGEDCYYDIECRKCKLTGGGWLPDIGRPYSDGDFRAFYKKHCKRLEEIIRENDEK